jgi:hypothetical protein
MLSEKEIERFRGYLIELPSGCIVFGGGTVRDGYGWFNHTSQDVSKLAHRVSFLIEDGSIDKDLCVLHHCDNPPCCNFSHLYQGTKQSNSNDAVVRKRYGSRAGTRNGNARLTDDQVAEIRAIKETEPLTTYAALAIVFGVTPENISLICRRKTHHVLCREDIRT